MVKFDCPNCGGQLQLRAPGASLVIVCAHCGSALDAKDPRHKKLSEHEANVKAMPPPTIPIGRRGTIDGVQWEHIGYLRRRVLYYGVSYHWSEYLLYNPYHGFRWLVESDGHWMFLKTINQVPRERP
jgi:hypothetical protein